MGKKKRPEEHRYNAATIRRRGNAWQADLRRGHIRHRRDFPFHDWENLNAVARALEEAQTYIDTITVEYNARTRSLSLVEIAEARRAIELLPPGTSLVDAARTWLTANRIVTERLSIAVAAERYIQEKIDTGKRERTISSARIQINRLAEAFPQSSVDGLTARDLHAWIETLKLKSPITRNNLIRDLATFFNWAVERDLCVTSPVANIPTSSTEDGLPDIYSTETVTALFKYLESKGAADLIAYHAMGFFAGIRTTELARLTDENIVDGIIQVTPKAAKTRTWRYIEMEPNLRAWLEAYPPKGPIQSAGRTRTENLRRLAGITWSNNVMRHSFASYHLAKHRDAGRTAHDLGHPNANLVYSTYRSLAQVADGVKYFQILPGSV